jgi:hypothetical protein
VQYHERSLVAAHAELAAIKAILKRGNYVEFSFDELQKLQDADADDEYDEDGDGPLDHISYMRKLAREAIAHVGYYENALKTAHMELAAFMALICRTNFNITLADLAEEEKEARAKKDCS